MKKQDTTRAARSAAHACMALAAALLFFAFTGEGRAYAGHDTFLIAAAPVRGVDTMGYGTPAPAAAPPRPGYGSAPGDYGRGYEGSNPAIRDIWNRESDFKARDYQLRHSPSPASARPPASDGRAYPVAPAPAPAPSLPKPPLPGDTDMPAVSPGPKPNKPAPGPRQPLKLAPYPVSFLRQAAHGLS